MKFKIISTIVVLFSCNYIFSQNIVTISGNAKSYSGDTLKIYKYSEYITKKQEILSSSIVDKDGNFMFKIISNNTICCFIDLIVFKGRIYIEPEKTYQIILPKKTDKSEEDKINPFFVQEEFAIQIINSDKKELNYSINKFDEFYFKSYFELFDKFKGTVNSQKATYTLKFLKDSFPDYGSLYFADYKKFEIAALSYICYKKNLNSIISEYFNIEPKYENTGYNEAFKQVALDFSGNWNMNSDFLNIIKNEKTLDAFNNFFKINVKNQNPIFLEYLLINELINNFNSQISNQEDLIKCLRNISESTNNLYHIKILENFIENSQNMIVGNIIPNFVLNDLSSKKVSLNDFKGKFIYLSFYSKDNYVCQKEIDVLQNVVSQNIDLLQVVTIWTGGSEIEMKQFVEKNSYNWTFLFSNDKNLLKKFKIVAYPTYFLINPNGKLLMYPAPSPANSFENQYYMFYQNWKRELLRKEEKKLGN